MFKVIFGMLAILVAAVLITAGALYYHFTRDLPKLSNLKNYNPLVVSEVFADDGTKVGEFWQECRFLLPYDRIPKRVINAFVASEDERFWDHKGVDFRSILRAFIENLKEGKFAQGGSTITQQVTRSFLLTREKKLERKVKEAILATQIEQNLGKEEILHLYLNQIFLGNRAYGVQAAARNYFHKDIQDLNLAELSMIAGLPSAPTTYSPINNMDMARQRQLHVLQQMLANDYITKREYQEALATPLKFYVAGTDKEFNGRHAPHFVEHVWRYVADKYGEEALYRGGLKIQTTLNLDMNRAADRAVKRGLFEMERRKGFRGPVATIASDDIQNYAEAVHRDLAAFDEPIYSPPSAKGPPIETTIEDGMPYKAVVSEMAEKGNATILIGRSTGTVAAADRAWIGRTPKVGDVYWVKRKDGDSYTIEQEPKLESALFSFNPLTGEVKAMIGGYSYRRSEFNRATQALRQPGSAFKPLIYAAALDKGYTPRTIVNDAPVVYQVGRQTWSPKNYSNKHNGPMPIRSALTHSINIIAVKVFHDIGIDYAFAYARKLGLTTPLAKYLSSALGASDVTLQEMTRAYGVFPAGGVRPELIFIRKMADKTGKVLEENTPHSLDPEHVFDGGPGGLASRPAGMNSDILLEGEKTIKKDGYKITPDEKEILYGAAIPPGHVITPQTAFLMVSMMRDVVDRGTGFKAKEIKRPAAGKTGTTNDESDAWFIGYVPNLIAGVWMGYDSRKPIGYRATGGVVSAPIWLYYMQDVLKDQPVLEFAKPADIEIAQIDSMAGGSAPENIKVEPEGEPYEDQTGGRAPASRGVDFLYQDMNKL